MKKFFLSCIFLSHLSLANEVVIGSKNFTENYILAEITAQAFEHTGEAEVVRRFGLGGTGITYGALQEGKVDLYPEYSGTISEVLLKKKNLSIKQIKTEIDKIDLEIDPAFGLNNTYALAVKKEKIKEYNLKNISDLKSHESIKAGFSYEFARREDGLKKMQQYYKLSLKNITLLDHALVYEALEQGNIDLIEVYSTDAKIPKYDLVLLRDDYSFFPDYEAVLFHQKGFWNQYPQTFEYLNQHVFGKIDSEVMQKLNAEVEMEKKTYRQVALNFLGKKSTSTSVTTQMYKRIWLQTKQHIKLVFVSLFFSIIFGISLGILASRSVILGQLILNFTGLLQTIPSLALLCFMIPILGIGVYPSFFALFLYGLLPIVRNTATALTQIPKSLKESASILGLSKMQKLTIVELPLSLKGILAGIKTSAVINVGTATLAAFVGAGGLGSSIVTGLSLNDNNIILQGAIPAAVLAIIINLFFELIEKLLPKGVR